MNKIFSTFLLIPILIAIIFLSACSDKDIYRSSVPWNDLMQEIPGKIECEFYDRGGEGVAYHDTDSINNGSGGLNPANGTFLNEFRMNESVDISYTKGRDIDNTIFNIISPALDQLYVGWTKPDEWINYTVDIKQTGTYSVGLMYTSNKIGGIALFIDGKDVSGTITIPTTYHPQDTVAWRQWHHWNYIDTLTKVHLPKGIHVLTLHTIVNGDMNYDFLDFKFSETKSL